MNITDNIKLKNKIMLAGYILSVILRLIFNYFLGVKSIASLVIVAIAVPLVLIEMLLIKKNLSTVIMYYNVFLFATTILAMFISDPSWANFILIYYGVLLMSLYEDLGILIVNAVISSGIIIFEFLSYKDEIFVGQGYYQLVFFVLYVVAGTIILSTNAIIIKKVFRKLSETYRNTEEEKAKSKMLLNKIGTTIDTLSTANNKIKDGISITSQISEEITAVAGSVTEITSNEVRVMNIMQESIEKGTDKVAEVSRSVKDMEALSKAIEEVVSEGSSKINTLSFKMDTVNMNILNVVKVMDELSEENRRIVQIINSINEISEQTNLLALNASIEAARAGEYGKGFVVVADEVRKLAEDSKVSTDKIEELLESVASVNESVEDTSNAMEESFASIDELNKNIVNISNTYSELDNICNELSLLKEN